MLEVTKFWWKSCNFLLPLFEPKMKLRLYESIILSTLTNNTNKDRILLTTESKEARSLGKCGPQTYIMHPDAVCPIYFLSDREDSQAYHLKWQKH